MKKKEPWISVKLINGSVVNFNYYHIASVVVTRDIKEAIVEVEVTLRKKIVDKENE